MATVYLYTSEFSFSGKAKNFVKKIFGRNFGGPKSVAESLLKGLRELSVDCKINQLPAGLVETACVLSDVNTLAWAIKRKQNGKIKKIIAGPNIVVTPGEAKGILKSSEIDKIIVPSQWVRDFYIAEAPELQPKVAIWPAGVDLPGLSTRKKDVDFTIINKLKEGITLYDQIYNHLEKQNYKVRVLSYGNFKQTQYFNCLDCSKHLIYLSESESQGLAMFEAWARNVPTLVWERGFWQAGESHFAGITASPYLTPLSGERFKDFNDFQEILPHFLNGQYLPREYIRQNFTNKITAQKYLDIIGQ